MGIIACGNGVVFNSVCSCSAFQKFAFPLALNHLTIGIFVPSFTYWYCSGRVFDNAEFYILVQQGSHPGIQNQTYLFILKLQSLQLRWLDPLR